MQRGPKDGPRHLPVRREKAEAFERRGSEATEIEQKPSSAFDSVSPSPPLREARGLRVSSARSAAPGRPSTRRALGTFRCGLLFTLALLRRDLIHGRFGEHRELLVRGLLLLQRSLEQRNG
jgi:hypothetical protein